MRWICLVSGVLLLCSLASPAAAIDLAWTTGTTCSGCGHCPTYWAAAGGGQFYGMVPGCCRYPPSACDNAWAGYCEEKARRQAFWYQLGTGGGSSCYRPTWNIMCWFR
jgi:hypothetical protein